MATNKRTCSVDDCDNSTESRGLCNKHYLRFKKHGTTDSVWPIPPEKRFWAKVEKTDTCWNWIGSISQRGYGNFKDASGTALSHRFSYELTNGPIPEGTLIDHVCHNRACVNPAHLRLASNKQNVEYREGPQANNTSGHRGVHRDRRRGKWIATVTHNGRSIQVGEFLDLEEASAAARAKRAELFTFPEVA